MSTNDPTLAGLKSVRPLAGLSGFKVLLASKDGRRWFVRKAAPSPELSSRLRRQMEKQLRFAERIPPPIAVPQVLEHGELDGCFYFDMEYVRGPDGISYIQRATYDQITSLADRLDEYLRAASIEKPLLSSSSSSFFSALYLKLCEVQRRTEGAIPHPVCSKLFLSLERLFHLDQLPQTLCHGDFTLENTIIAEGQRIYVIDLLEAPFEHYWQDLAKLHQDLAGGWYSRNRRAVAQCVLDYLRRRLQQTGDELHEAYRSVHPLLMAIVFARILPYATSEQERQFVLHRIEHFAEAAT